METVACSICHGTITDVVFKNLPDLLIKRRDVSTRLVRCDQCGLIFQNPRPTPDEMGMHYPPEYDSYEPVIQNKATSGLLRLAYNFGMWKRSHYITRFKKGGKLLDIGCASGTFLNAMRNFGHWDLSGVELSDYAARIAREQFHLNVFTGSLENSNYPDQSFDVVTLWDVLEHLHDPVKSLQEINRILKYDGLLVLRSPNGDSWDAKLFGQYWAGLDSPRHLYVFTPSTLSKALDASGFHINHQDTLSGGYPTFLLSLRFWLTDHPGSDKTKNILLAILHHPIARILTVPIFYSIGYLGKGPALAISAVKHKDSL